MNKNVLSSSLVFFTAVALIRPAAAAAKPAARQEAPAAREADRIDREVLDIDALYWAGRIESGAKDGELTYEKLEAASKRWAMTAQTKKLFFARVRKILDEKSSRPLTPEEKAKLDDAKKRVGLLLAPGRKDEALISELTREDVLDVKARHWAWRIAVVKDVAYEELLRNSAGWLSKPEFRQELLRRIKTLLDAGSYPREWGKTDRRRFEAAAEKAERMLW